MKAMILAAGRGSRLRPITDTVPKPLVKAGGFRLFDWQLWALKKAGITQVVMNVAHLADSFEPVPAELAEKGFEVTIVREGDRAEDALESLGGIVNALDELAPAKDEGAPVVILAGDVVHAFDIGAMIGRKAADFANGRTLVHLVTVPNPDFHAAGDLTVKDDGSVVPGLGPHTYGCIMMVAPQIFAGLPKGPAKLFPWLWQFARSGKMSAEVWEGFWENVGSATELARLEKAIAGGTAPLPFGD